MTRALTAAVAMLAITVLSGAVSAQTPPTPPAVAPRPIAPTERLGPQLGVPSQMPSLSFEEIVGEPAQNQEINIGAVALGAVAGVITFNIVSATFFPLSMAAGGPLVGTLVADSAIAASRIYAVSSAVVGGYLGHWLVGR